MNSNQYAIDEWFPTCIRTREKKVSQITVKLGNSGLNDTELVFGIELFRTFTTFMHILSFQSNLYQAYLLFLF